MPHILFSQRHPRRAPFQKTSRLPLPIFVSTECRDLRFAHITDAKNISITFIRVTFEGHIITSDVDFLNPIRESQTVVGHVLIAGMLFVGCYVGFVAIEKRRSLLYFANERDLVQKPFAFGGIEHIASRARIVVMSDVNGQVFGLDIAEFPTVRQIISSGIAGECPNLK
jgi:hypothetical protein